VFCFPFLPGPQADKLLFSFSFFPLCSAGSTDPSLSDTGKTQMQRLAEHFRTRGIHFSHVFSSDLQRARITAEWINGGREPVQLPELREQHFDTLEGASNTGWSTYASGYVEESESEMGDRANGFLHDYILPVLFNSKDRPGNEEAVAVVAHGVILRVLWSRLADLFNRRDIKLGPGVDASTTPAWSNTGYMELDIKPSSSQASRTAATTTAYAPSQGLYRTTSGTAGSPHSATASASSARSTSPTATTSRGGGGVGGGGGAELSGWTMTVLTIDDTSHLEDHDGVRTSKHDGQQKQQQKAGGYQAGGYYQFPGISETVSLPGAANQYY